MRGACSVYIAVLKSAVLVQRNTHLHIHFLVYILAAQYTAVEMVAESFLRDIIRQVGVIIGHQHLIIPFTEGVVSGRRERPMHIEAMTYMQVNMVLLIVIGLIVVVGDIAVLVYIFTGRVVSSVGSG